MPKISKTESTIQKFYRRSSLHQLMFGFVQGVRATLHTVPVKQAIRMFMEQYDLTDDDYNADSALVIFDRMQKELFETKKNQ